jgi:hypothetical protein
MPEAAESAVEAREKDRTVALIIAVLALLLALSEIGAKKAQHISMEKNIEASDLFNFYQAKKIRSTIAETASTILDAQKSELSNAKAQEALDSHIGEFNAIVARLEKDPKKPEDSLDALQERANGAVEARELANHRLEHYELASGLTQIAIVLASAAIITGISALIWLSVALGIVGALLVAFGFFAPTILTFIA